MNSGTRRSAATGMSIIALLTAGCSGEPKPIDEALTAEQTFFLDDLNRRGLKVKRAKALDFIDWYCRNLIAPISEIETRTAAAGVEGAEDTNEMLNAGYSACRSTGAPTGG